MKIDRELIEHVAEVARLDLTDREVKEFIPQLKEVLDAFGKLSEIEADDDPSFQPVNLKDSLRDDEPGKCLSQDEALSGAESKEGYFMGPKAV